MGLVLLPVFVVIFAILLAHVGQYGHFGASIAVFDTAQLAGVFLQIVHDLGAVVQLHIMAIPVAFLQNSLCALDDLLGTALGLAGLSQGPARGYKRVLGLGLLLNRPAVK